MKKLTKEEEQEKTTYQLINIARSKIEHFKEAIRLYEIEITRLEKEIITHQNYIKEL